MKNRLLEHDTNGRGEQAASEVESQGAVGRLLARAEQFIADYPKTTLGVGLALGVTLGWIIKRR